MNIYCKKLFLILMAASTLLLLFFTSCENKSQKNLRICSKNLKIIAKAIEMYKKTHNNQYPATLDLIPKKYLKEIPTCPSAKRDTYSSSYIVEKDMFILYCQGHNHKDLNIPKDYPRITQKGFIEKP